MVVSLLTAGMSAAVFSGSGTVTIESGSFTETVDYVVWVSGGTFYSKNGQTGAVTSSADSDALIQSAVDAVSSAGGGSVHVKSGSYSATTTLKDGVTLTLDRGVSGVSVSIDAGATATLIDLENSVTKVWSSGTLIYHIDSGNLLTSQSLNSTEYWVGSDNRTDVLANPEQTASYIVWTDGTTIYAKNGTTGEVEFSGTDAATVINNALANLTSGRTWKEKLVLKGVFTINSPIQMVSYAILEGGYLVARDNFDDYLITIPSGTNNFEISNMRLYGNPTNQTNGGLIKGVGTASYDICNFRLENLQLYSFKDYAVWLSYVSHFFIENLEIDSVSEGIVQGKRGLFIDHAIEPHINNVMYEGVNYGIYLTYINRGVFSAFTGAHAVYTIDANVSIHIDHTYHSHFSDIVSEYWNIQGIEVLASNNNDFKGVVSRYVKGHLLMVYDSNRNKFIGGTLSDVDDKTASQYAIYCSGTSTGNIFESLDLVNARYGFYESGTADYNVVTKCYFSGNINTVRPFGSNTKIYRNIGFITEASGTATIANGEWASHGLAGTPTVVTVTTQTPTYDGVPVVVGVAATNSTHIQFSAYWTNGTAITADAINIAWSAEYKP